jgi:hypothetical protein
MLLKSKLLAFTLLTTILVAAFSAMAAQPDSMEDAAETIAHEYFQTKFDMPATSTSLLAAEYERKLSPPVDQALSPTERRRFLAPSKYAPVHHPLIKKLASLIVAGAENDFQKVVLIHNFVLWRLTYVSFYMEPYKNSDTMSSWKGQVYSCMNEPLKKGGYRRIVGGEYQNLQECGVIQNKSIWRSVVLLELFSGVDNCAGYSYLLASLARAAGVPTRVVREPQTDSGFGHYWNQVFINGRWLVVDATFDDLHDKGQYRQDSTMKLDFTYFLVDPQEAARLEPKYHKIYKIYEN